MTTIFCPYCRKSTKPFKEGQYMCSHCGWVGHIYTLEKPDLKEIHKHPPWAKDEDFLIMHCIMGRDFPTTEIECFSRNSDELITVPNKFYKHLAKEYKNRNKDFGKERRVEFTLGQGCDIQILTVCSKHDTYSKKLGSRITYGRYQKAKNDTKDRYWLLR